MSNDDNGFNGIDPSISCFSLCDNCNRVLKMPFFKQRKGQIATGIKYRLREIHKLIGPYCGYILFVVESPASCILPRYKFDQYRTILMYLSIFPNIAVHRFDDPGSEPPTI
jgi:hypothetical protein